MSKIAVAGKGGVGKTTFSALLSYVLTAAGETVYAIDADPNATLGQALAFPQELLDKLQPIIEMKDLVQERTGAAPGQQGAYFRLNPRVDDIPARFAQEYRGIRLLEMGPVKAAGAGCACPENAMVKALVSHLMLRERETVLLDMVAGLEHLGRGTAASVDAMFIVVEPGQRSLTVGADVNAFAKELGIPAIWAVGNKVRDERDLAFIAEHLGDVPLAGWMPRDDRVMEADMTGTALFDLAPDIADRVRKIAQVAGLLPAGE